MLVEMLIRVLDQVAPRIVGQVAESVGRAYGAELAAEIGVPMSPATTGRFRRSPRTGLGFSVDPTCRANNS